MSNPIPTDTPARRALIEMLGRTVHPLPFVRLRDLSQSGDEDDAAALVHCLDRMTGFPGPDWQIVRAASVEIHEVLRARGLSVSSRGKLVRVASEEQLEERDRLRREAGPDPDARHDDHEREGDR